MTVGYPDGRPVRGDPNHSVAVLLKHEPMLFGFRKQFRLGRLLRLNLSKRGVSLSCRLGRLSTTAAHAGSGSAAHPARAGSPESWSVGVEPVTASTLRG
jgi:hypothetical protein